MFEYVGWFGAFALVVTIGAQVLKQFRSGTSEGVSAWLFVGQILGAGSFLAYAISVGDRVFIAAQATLLMLSIAGMWIFVLHRRRAGRGSRGAS